jgi:hypothetical protein
MATHNDTSKLVSYTASSFPSLGNSERFISNELRAIQNAIDTLIQVAKSLEARMNTANLP